MASCRRTGKVTVRRTDYEVSEDGNAYRTEFKVVNAREQPREKAVVPKPKWQEDEEVDYVVQELINKYVKIDQEALLCLARQ
jgi:hypothetical protein